MKPLLFIAASLLLTSASFAQPTTETTKKTKAAPVIQAHKPAITGKGAEKKKSEPVLQTEQPVPAQENSVAVVEKIKHEKKEKKEKIEKKEKKEKKEVVVEEAAQEAGGQSVVSQSGDVAAQASSRATVKANHRNNKVKEDESVNTGTELAVVNHGQVVKQQNHGAEVREAAHADKPTRDVKAVAVKSHKVHARASKGVKTSNKKVKAVKISPASVRAKTRANVNSGIRIN